MKPALPAPRRFASGQLQVEVHRTRAAMGAAAGLAVAGHLKELLTRQPTVRAIFACAPSQNEFLAALVAQPGIAWSRVTVFHMDEYVGLRGDDPASFRHFLRARLTSQVDPGAVHELAGDSGDPAREGERYGRLLAAGAIDFVCLGIGENGHLAFNDPPVADFNDPAAVKVVALDHACRAQQVNDGCFAALDLVPREALTLTIPALLSGRRMFCIVPGVRKAAAVKAALEGPIATACPASALRRHAAATLFLDEDSAGQLAR